MFVAETKSTSKVGAPFSEGTFQGPQVSKAQFENVLKYIDIGKKEGAKVDTGGSRQDGDGYFVEPTVFTNVSDLVFMMQSRQIDKFQVSEDMQIVKEEIFGPVIVIGKFSDEADAIKKANNTSYGLAAAVFTENIRRGHRIAARLAAGMVWINSSGDSHYGIPFGGYKSSGIGRELGPYALDAYTQTKAIHVNLGVDL